MRNLAQWRNPIEHYADDVSAMTRRALSAEPGDAELADILVSAPPNTDDGCRCSIRCGRIVHSWNQDTTEIERQATEQITARAYAIKYKAPFTVRVHRLEIAIGLARLQVGRYKR